MGDKAISVVIPVYNSMPYFERTLDSLLAQTLDQSAFEVIIADDGSTDGSERLADEVAQAAPQLVRVLHLAPSGGPAHPRNVGLEQAQGTYVFFLDSDDFLGPEALERMYDHAREWESDVLVPKQVGECGRKVPSSMFRLNQPRANVWTSRVFYTLSPLKLFKASLLRDNDIRFPEELRYREDEIFTSKALFCADTVSVASDYDYCHIVERDDGSNLSLEPQIDFHRSYSATRMLLELADAYAPEEDALDKIVLPRIMKTVWFASAYAASHEQAPARDTLFDKLRILVVERWGSEGLRGHLPHGVCTLVDLICARDYERAATCFGLLEASPNASYAGVNTDAGKVRIEGGSVVLYALDESVSIDITSTVSIDDVVEGFTVSKQGIKARCSRAGHELLPEPVEVALVFARRDGTVEIACEASEIGFLDSVSTAEAAISQAPVSQTPSDSAPAARVGFTFDVGTATFAEMCACGASMWDCFLQFGSGDIMRRVRFGAHMTPECRATAPAKGRIWTSPEGTRLAIRYTPAGNIIFRVR